ncbi:MAG: isoprenylcysteine carboxylmethyltransferase family protein, partial [Oscillospiraceae bacterium]|nr:isoprenylcysteine carboxylmethyltransferase family protein [Oscillospiraceae bacterium]
MTKKLFIQALVKYLAGIVLLGLLIFLPAGTLAFPNGWLLMALLFIPMLGAGVVMMIFDPPLLEKRLNAKERQGEQKEVIWQSGVMFIVAFVLAGLNFRLGWLSLPKWVVWAASILFLLAYLMWGEVLRENAWLSRTVEVQEGQIVVDSGLYGVVRHPMYAASVLLFLSMPLILNSIFSFLVMLAYLPLISKRIRNEEELLKKELPGYDEYMERVKYR